MTEPKTLPYAVRTECRRYDGRVAIVTGAAQGLGRVIARRLAEEGATHGQKVVDLAKRSQGSRGLIAGEKPFPSQLADGADPYSAWDHAFWFSQAVTLGVGTQEVLKNVVAERMLGLPRELDPTAKQPWSETKQ